MAISLPAPPRAPQTSVLARGARCPHAMLLAEAQHSRGDLDVLLPMEDVVNDFVEKDLLRSRQQW